MRGRPQRRLIGLGVGLVALLAAEAAAGATLHLAVFNFQMTSNTPAWGWLEKGLADKITTDFTRSRRLSVVARDEMQMLAAKLKWAPEMALSNAATAARIKKQLRIDYLVTGVYAVADGQVKLTCSPVIRVVFKGTNDSWIKRHAKAGRPIRGATANLPDEKSPCIRAVVTDDKGQKAWTNPIRV